MAKTPKSRKALVIYNPVAGNMDDVELSMGSIVHNLCKVGGYTVTVKPTIPDMVHADTLDLIEPDFDLIVAAGGDGTIRLVLGAVSEKAPQIPVAMLPLGTGNQLARNLGIYQDNLLTNALEMPLKVMLGERSMRIDLGLMNGEYFCVAAGAGPLSDAVIGPSKQEKQNFKMLAYVGSIIQTFALPPVTFNVKVDDDAVFDVSASGIFITNVADLGVGTLADTAEVHDGLLDLCIMTPAELPDYLQLGFRFAGGFVGGEAPYYIRKTKIVEIKVVPGRSQMSDFQSIAHKVRTALKGESDEPPRYKQVAAMVDGDAWGTTPMRIEVKPSAVKVMIP